MRHGAYASDLSGLSSYAVQPFVGRGLRHSDHLEAMNGPDDSYAHRGMQPHTMSPALPGPVPMAVPMAQFRPAPPVVAPPPAPLMGAQQLVTPGQAFRDKRKRRTTATRRTDGGHSSDPDGAAMERSSMGGGADLGGASGVGGSRPAAPSKESLKEQKRLKRLLRNRVSAQLARERKRSHLTDLEDNVNKLKDMNEQLEGKVLELTKENETLRRLLLTTRAKKPKP
eukprot:jgi/Mesvir1/1973/Mv16600-RA.1